MNAVGRSGGLEAVLGLLERTGERAWDAVRPYLADGFRWTHHPTPHYPEGLSGDANAMIDLYAPQRGGAFETTHQTVDEVLQAGDEIIVRISNRFRFSDGVKSEQQICGALFFLTENGRISRLDTYYAAPRDAAAPVCDIEHGPGEVVSSDAMRPVAEQAVRALLYDVDDIGQYCAADFRWRHHATIDYPEGLSGDLADLIATFGGEEATWACERYELKGASVFGHVLALRLHVRIHLQARPDQRRRADAALLLRFDRDKIADLEIYPCVVAL
ncbi:MAG: nuclear transport factor 2 family protein [Pseudomonadota bacterium]